MSEVIEQESTELVTLPLKESALAIYSTVGGLDPLIEQIRDKVVGTVYDMATAKGRDECRSDAAKVGRSKQAIERMGKDLSAYHKEIPKKIDAERKRAFDALEVLQKQVRQPLTEWEEAEEARVQRHKVAVAGIAFLVEGCRESQEDIRSAIEAVKSVQIDESWEEFEAEARRAKDKALETLTAALTVQQRYESEQAELAKLRAEAEERRLQDERERISREAAQRATQEAEEKARAERDAAAKRESNAKAAQEKAEQETRDAVERQKQAEARAEAEALAATERARQAAENARLEEQQRQRDEQARMDAEARAREANKAHKAKVNNTALSAFIAGGMTAECAKLAVTLIAKGEIPAVAIHY